MDISKNHKNNTKNSLFEDNSWDDVTAAFENDLYRRNQSDATINMYITSLNTFSGFYRNHLKKPGPYISRLQEADLKAFIDYLRNDRQLKVSSVNRHIAALRSFSKFLFVKGIHRRMLTMEIKTYRVKALKNALHLNKTEVRKLIAAIDPIKRNGRRNLAILHMFLQCGLRVGELIRLTRDDVIIKKTTGTVQIRDEEGDVDRLIPLNLATRRALTEYLDTRGPVGNHEPLFVSERQGHMSIASVQHMIKRILCIAGREDLSTNDLRHHFAMKFFAKSQSLSATQQVLGHKDPTSTVRYARATIEEIQETVNGMDS